MQRTLIVRGDPEDVRKLRAFYRLLYLDTGIEIIQKPLRGAVRPVFQRPLQRLKPNFCDDKERRKGAERRTGKDRRKIIDLQLHQNRRRGVDRRRGSERRAIRAV
jgi:hypothetical protein